MPPPSTTGCPLSSIAWGASRCSGIPEASAIRMPNGQASTGPINGHGIADLVERGAPPCGTAREGPQNRPAVRAGSIIEAQDPSPDK